MLANLLGKNKATFVKAWTISIAAYSATAGVALLYLTDWKAVVQYVPFYNGKFKTEK